MKNKTTTFTAVNDLLNTIAIVTLSAIIAFAILFTYTNVTSPTKEATEVGYVDLSADRVVNLYGEVNFNSAEQVITDLRKLNKNDPEKEIVLRIVSPGGSVYAGLMIIDAMKQIKAPVRTVCEGMCASMGALILFSGDEGRRNSMKNAMIMIHSLSSQNMGNLDELEVQMQEANRLQHTLNMIVVNNSKLSLDQVKYFMKTDYYMSSDTALVYGMIDEIL